MRQVFAPPRLDPLDREVLRLIDGLRDDLRHRVAEPRRWGGSLRRAALARAVQASNSIEGYNASLDDVVAAVDGEPTLQASEETRLALGGYRDAMTYVLQVAQDRDADVDEGLIKALHFMMLKYDLGKSPGRWRPGYIGVRSEETGELVYEGPDAEEIPGLIEAMVSQLRDDQAPVLIRAAMAHLNLVMIHPFRDGNGRMGRCLQTLALAREQIVAPVFSSIEEYLGHNTRAYYDVLAEVGGGAWNPHHDTLAVDAILPHRPPPAGQDPSTAHRGDRAPVGRVRLDRAQRTIARALCRRSGGGGARLPAAQLDIPFGPRGDGRRGDLRIESEPRAEGDGERWTTAAGRRAAGPSLRG